MKPVETSPLISSLSELWELCPDMRLGQLMATLGLLADDSLNRSLWDVEDGELTQVIDRFRQQLEQRRGDSAHNGSHSN